MKPPQFKLGKLPAVVDRRTLKISNYLTPTFPPPPRTQNWSETPSADYPVPWPMFLNDTLGDCTCASAGHLISEWAANSGKPYMPSDRQILEAYEIVGGYTPTDISTDRGAVMLDVLKYWRNVGIAGHRITAFASINIHNSQEVLTAIWLFGGIYAGIQLPLDAQGVTMWTVGPEGTLNNGAPGSWGGHCVPVVDYHVKPNMDKNNPGHKTHFDVITWGAKIMMTRNFMQTYCDEAYVILSPDWLDSKLNSPNNFNLAALQADLGKF